MHDGPSEDGPSQRPASAHDAEAAAAQEQAFVDGFLGARDKHAFLRLCGVRFSIGSGAQALKLIAVRIATGYAVGVVAPGFATAELSHQPLPGALVSPASELRLRYQSREVVRDLTLAEARGAPLADG